MSAPVVFVLINALQRAETVGQLVDALAPHPVHVHHDFNQQPGFRLQRPNLRLQPVPHRTGWASWGFAQAVLGLLRDAVSRQRARYVQLLSPTCLPVRPVADFVDHVAEQAVDANMDLMSLDDDPDVLMSYAYRAFAPQGSLRAWLLDRSRRAWHGRPPQMLRQAGLVVYGPRTDGRQAGPAARASLALARAARRGWLGRHPFVDGLLPAVGSTWFGARTEVVEDMLAHSEHVAPAFVSMKMPDEHLLASLMVGTGARIGPSNHWVTPFQPDGHPRWMELDDLPIIRRSGRWFARKVPEDPAAAVRQALLAGETMRMPTADDPT